MKRFLSMALCVLMFITMFTATAGQVMAAGNANEFFTVTSGEFKNDKITYTIRLNPNLTKVTGVNIQAYFDGEALKVSEDETDGAAAMSGMFVKGYQYDSTDVYAIAFMEVSGVNTGSAGKDFATITFEAISDVRDMEAVTFKCVEFITDDGNADNDIKKINGAQEFYADIFYSLSRPAVNEVNSYNDGLRVVWTDTQGAESYTLLRKAKGEAVWTVLAEGLTVNEYVDNSVAKGTIYYYTVEAFNEYGATGYDATGLAGMNFGNIESINAVATATGAKITWSALNGAEKYEVYRKLAVSSNWQLVKTVTECEYVDSSLASGVEYDYKVKAIQGEFSADMSCEPARVKYIATPEVTVNNVSGGISVTFDEVGGAAKYVVERSVNGSAFEKVAEITDEFQYFDEDVVADSSYTYRVQAVAADGMTSLKATTQSIVRLGMPTGLRVSNTKYGTELVWNKVNGALTYEIFVKTDSGEWVSTVILSATRYDDIDLVSGETYTYAVSASNDTGDSGFDESVTILYLDAPEITSVSSIESGIKVVWEPVDGAEKYNVYRAEVGSDNWEHICQVAGKSYVDDEAVHGTYYKYNVTAVAGAYESAFLTSGVEGMYFGNVSWIKATPGVDCSVITWEKLSAADNYEVYRKTASQTKWTKLAKVTGTSYTDNTMESGIVYYYMVKALKGNNVSEMICDPASAKIIATPKATAKNANNGIQITVTPVNGAESYVLEKKINGKYEVIATLTKNLSYVDTDVEAECEYEYRVYAVSTDINSGIREIGPVLRLSCPKITSIQNSVVGIEIEWTPLDGAESYQVLRKEEGDKKWTVIEDEVKGTAYLDADVFSDDTYTYTINANMADGGQSGYAENGMTYKFLDTPDLESVAKVSGGVQFVWSKVDGATSYVVYRKTSSTAWVKIATTSGTSYVDKNLKDGTYIYNVRAVDGEYESAIDDEGLSIKYVGVGKPATPKLSKVANTASGVKVTWSASKNATSYIVYRKTYNAKTKKWGSWENLGKSTSTSFVDKKAKSGTYYIYTVRATNAAGNSGYDSKGLKIYFLATPTVTTANANAGVTVKWTKAAGATGYIVYRKTTGGWTKIATVKGAGTLSYTDKKASAGVTYRYTVKAYYSSYFSAYNTNGVAVRRLTTPTLKKATSAKAGITFTWTQSKGATGYIVYRKTGKGSWQKIATVKGTSTVKYLDKSAKKGTTYTYTVKAYYGTSTSAYNTKGLAIKDKY
ncbi:MAG: hypothetical protein IKT55_01565 [Clostridia bacterium]|nr:hypothetical protein [Clostridia bacterium]